MRAGPSFSIAWVGVAIAAMLLVLEMRDARRTRRPLRNAVVIPVAIGGTGLLIVAVLELFGV